MSKYINYSAYTGCISLYIYCLITCNIKSLLNVPKMSQISRKISQVSRFPAKSPDSRKKFVFLPKQPLLELSPPVLERVSLRAWEPVFSGVPNDGFLINSLKTLFKAIQSTVRSLEMHSKRRCKICICSVILGKLEGLSIIFPKILDAI